MRTSLFYPYISLLLLLALIPVPCLAAEPGEMVVIVKSDIPPYEFLDASGQPAGFLPGLAAALSRETGMPVRVATRPEDISSGLVIAGVFTGTPAQSPDLAGVLRPVTYSYYVKGDPATPARTVLVPQAGRMAWPNTPPVTGEIIPAADAADALVRLEMGLADRAFVDEAQAGYVLAHTGLSDISLVPGPKINGTYSLAAYGGDLSSREAVRDGLARVRASGEWERLIQAHFPPDPAPQERIPPLIVTLFTPLALVLLAVLSWSWALKYQVNRKTAELQQELEERQRAEEALRNARNHLHAIIDSIADPVFVKDRQHRFVVLNEACCRFIGRTREELLGKPDAYFFQETELAVFHEHDELVFSTGNDDMNEEFLTDAAGIRHTILTKKTLYTDPAGKQYIVGTIADITARKQLDEETRRFNEELEIRVRERTHALETATREMESFTYSVSHDLRAPLRAIDGFASLFLIEQEGTLTDEGKRLLSVIRQNIRQMNLLIEGLLNLSRTGRQSLKLAPVDHGTVIREVFDDLREERRGLDITLEMGELPPCQADPSMIRQVWFNLLSNALKFSRDREHVVISVGSCRQDGEFIYYIRDNGVGFDMAYYDKLFGVFQRLHSTPVTEGTGVGLAIVQRIIQRHGGKIWAKSKPGGGATFYFSLGGGQQARGHGAGT